MRTILVPTDFSECSAAAAKYAIYLAEKTERKLLFFHSTFNLIPTKISTISYLNEVKLDKNIKLKKLTLFIENIYKSLKIKRDVNNTKFVVHRSPSVLESISETINEQFIDLIIIGTHGATGFKKIFLGSNAASIIEQSYCPVLAIPNKYKFNGIKTIAYACSDLDNLQIELKKIIPLAQKMEASIQIFHIISLKKEILKYENFNSKVYMQSIVGHFKFNNMSLDIIDSGDNSLVESINNFVKHSRPDMLAMLTNKRSFFEKILTTSQTKEISYQLSIPLMAVKTDKKTE